MEPPGKIHLHGRRSYEGLGHSGCEASPPDFVCAIPKAVRFEEDLVLVGGREDAPGEEAEDPGRVRKRPALEARTSTWDGLCAGKTLQMCLGLIHTSGTEVSSAGGVNKHMALHIYAGPIQTSGLRCPGV